MVIFTPIYLQNLYIKLQYSLIWALYPPQLKTLKRIKL